MRRVLAPVPVAHSHLEVLLRRLERRDRDEWEALRTANELWLRPWAASSPGLTRRLNHRERVRAYDEQWRRGLGLPYVIQVDGLLAGEMHLNQIRWGAERSAGVGYWVAQEWAGQGIAPAALSALIEVAFRQVQVHRVEIHICLENHPSIRVVEKLGLRREGIRQRAIHIAGEWRDHYLYAVTEEEWAPGRAVRATQVKQVG